MSTLTKEWLQSQISAIKAVGITDSNTLQAFEIALASLESEPVSEFYHEARWGWYEISEGDKVPERSRIPLYRVPPAPVSVPEWTNEQCLEFLSIAFRHAEINGDLELDDIRLGVKMVNDSCASMLQGADEKPELTVWYGSMPETNSKANWTAILHRKGEGPCMDGFTIDRSEYPGRVLYAADRVRYLIGEKSERPSILDYDADAHSEYVKTGNSPVIPDGWVACSERMPEKGRTLALFGKRIKEVCANYVDEGYIGDDGEFYFFDWEGGPRIDDCHPYDKAIVTHWMYWELPAAPKQEDL